VGRAGSSAEHEGTTQASVQDVIVADSPFQGDVFDANAAGQQRKPSSGRPPDLLARLPDRWSFHHRTPRRG